MSAAGVSKSKPIQVWTACHLDHKDRLGHLISMVESVTTSVPKESRSVLISMSHDAKHTPDANKMKALRDLGATVFEHSAKKSQLEHLIHIVDSKEVDVKGEALVLFMDDDDLLLPAEYASARVSCGTCQTMVGVQKVFGGGNQPEHFMTSEGFVLDFSGYTTQVNFAADAISAAREFVKKSKMPSTADLEITNYLDFHTSLYTHNKPFVSRRVWDNPKTWKIDLEKAIAQLNDTAQ